MYKIWILWLILIFRNPFWKIFFENVLKGPFQPLWNQMCDWNQKNFCFFYKNLKSSFLHESYVHDSEVSLHYLLFWPTVWRGDTNYHMDDPLTRGTCKSHTRNGALTPFSKNLATRLFHHFESYTNLKTKNYWGFHKFCLLCN